MKNGTAYLKMEWRTCQQIQYSRVQAEKTVKLLAQNSILKGAHLASLTHKHKPNNSKWKQPYVKSLNTHYQTGIEDL
jgi:hypothetical protein